MERCLCQRLGFFLRYSAQSPGVLEKSSEICYRTHFPSVTFLRLASSDLSPNLLFHIFPPLVHFTFFVHFVEIALCGTSFLLSLSLSLSQVGQTASGSLRDGGIKGGRGGIGGGNLCAT